MTHDAPASRPAATQTQQNTESMQRDQPALPIRLRATQPVTGYTCPRCGTRHGTLPAFDHHIPTCRKEHQ